MSNQVEAASSSTPSKDKGKANVKFIKKPKSTPKVNLATSTANPEDKGKGKMNAKPKSAQYKKLSPRQIEDKKKRAAISAAKRDYPPFVGRKVYFASKSEQNNKPHTKFTPVSIHTAKCDGCEEHNTLVIQRCFSCGYHMCRPCMIVDKTGIHPLHDHLDWEPSKMPHTTPRNAARLGVDITPGRQQKKSVCGAISAHIVTGSDYETEDTSEYEEWEGAGDIDSTQEKHDYGKMRATASRLKKKISAETEDETNELPDESTVRPRQQRAKRKRSTDSDSDGMFVLQSDSEDDGDDEYVPLTRIRPAAKNIDTRSAKKRETSSYASAMAASTSGGNSSTSAMTAFTSIENTSNTQYLDMDDDDIYNATPLSSPALRKRQLNTKVDTVAASNTHEASGAPSPNYNAATTTDHRIEEGSIIVAANVSRASSSDLSSLPRTPSVEDEAAETLMKLFVRPT